MNSLRMANGLFFGGAAAALIGVVLRLFVGADASGGWTFADLLLVGGEPAPLKLKEGECDERHHEARR